MEYVEFLRVRRVCSIFASCVAVIAIFAIATMIYSSIGTTGTGESVGVTIGDATDMKHHKLTSYLQTQSIPLGLLLGFAGYVAIVVATVFASSLNKENDGLDYVFVKPIRREIIAMRYAATDAVGILAMFAFTIVAELVSLAIAHLFGRIVIDAHAFWVGALGLGVAFMWYGILQAITATYRGKGGTIVAFSWGFFILLTSAGYFTFLGPLFLGLVHVLNFVNPIAYFSQLVSHGGDYKANSVLGLGLEARVLVVWAIALVGTTIAANVWKRVEA